MLFKDEKMILPPEPTSNPQQIYEQIKINFPQVNSQPLCPALYLLVIKPNFTLHPRLLTKQKAILKIATAFREEIGYNTKRKVLYIVWFIRTLLQKKPPDFSSGKKNKQKSLNK